MCQVCGQCTTTLPHKIKCVIYYHVILAVVNIIYIKRCNRYLKIIRFQ